MPKEANKKESKPKKHFMKDFKAELKRVVWPTPKQLANNTFAVITIVLIIAVIVFALDFAFEKMNTYGIEKIKSVVEVQNSVNNETNDNSESSDNTDSNTEATNEATGKTNTVNE